MATKQSGLLHKVKTQCASKFIEQLSSLSDNLNSSFKTFNAVIILTHALWMDLYMCN